MAPDSSAPHLVVDPLVVGAEIVLALQTVVARGVDPVRAAVLSCTDLRTDGARNAIPTRVTVTGDTRSFDASVQELLPRGRPGEPQRQEARRGRNCRSVSHSQR